MRYLDRFTALGEFINWPSAPGEGSLDVPIASWFRITIGTPRARWPSNGRLGPTRITPSHVIYAAPWDCPSRGKTTNASATRPDSHRMLRSLHRDQIDRRPHVVATPHHQTARSTQPFHRHRPSHPSSITGDNYHRSRDRTHGPRSAPTGSPVINFDRLVPTGRYHPEGGSAIG